MSKAYDDGFHDIVGVDIVPEVLETMRCEGSQMKSLLPPAICCEKQTLSASSQVFESNNGTPGLVN